MKNQVKIAVEPPELASIVQKLNIAAALLVVLIGLKYIASDLLAPIILVIFVTSLLYPIYSFFRGKGFSSILSLVLMIISFLVVIIAFALFIGWAFSLIHESLGVYMNGVASEAKLIGLSKDLTVSLTTFITQNALAIFSFFANNFTNILLYVLVIPILSFSILLQVDSFQKNGITDKLVNDNDLLLKLKTFAKTITIYIIGKFKVNLVTATGFTIALYFIGVDYAIIWGILMLFLSFIPLVGVYIASVPPLIISFATLGPIGAVYVLIAAFITSTFADQIAEPYIQGKMNKIIAPALLLSVIFNTWLFGPIGAVLSAPLTVLMKLILEDYSETKWIASLMQGDYEQSKKEIEGVSNKQSIFSRFSPKRFFK